MDERVKDVWFERCDEVERRTGKRNEKRKDG